jgi:4-carboxymuconolactone decarboxylase
MSANKLGRFATVWGLPKSPEQIAVMAQLTDGPRGKIPTPFRMWLSHPALAARMEQMSVQLLSHALLSPSEREIAILVSATAFACPYVVAAHSERALQQGMPASVIADIRAGLTPSLADPREQAIFDITTALSRTVPVSEALYQRGVAHLGHDGIVELFCLLGHYISVYYTFNFYQVLPG